MPAQRVSAFGAFFFVVGTLLLAGSVGVALAAGEARQVLAAGAVIGFGIAGAICFVAAALTERTDPGVKPSGASAGDRAPRPASRTPPSGPSISAVPPRAPPAEGGAGE